MRSSVKERTLVMEHGEVSIDVPEGGDQARITIWVGRTGGGGYMHRLEAGRQETVAWLERCLGSAMSGWIGAKGGR